MENMLEEIATSPHALDRHLPKMAPMKKLVPTKTATSFQNLEVQRKSCVNYFRNSFALTNKRDAPHSFA